MEQKKEMRIIEQWFLEKDKILVFPNGQTIPNHLKYWRVLLIL
jgi:hypothetical protein